jgi:hypothetical protein
MFTVLKGNGVLVGVVAGFCYTRWGMEEVWVKVCLIVGRDDRRLIGRRMES